MKLFFNLSILLSTLFFVASCGEAPKSETAETVEEAGIEDSNETAADEVITTNSTVNPSTPATTTTTKPVTTPNAKAESTITADYIVDAKSCKMLWKGSKLTGGEHTGTINVQSGNVSVKDGAIISGSFILDMKSIKDVDLKDPKDKAELEGHLKSADFFDVANHPTAKFEIRSVTTNSERSKGTHTIIGSLTIKGISKDVIIPARIKMNEKNIGVRSLSFTINRTEWDIKFHSGLLGTAKDMIINDEIEMRISLAGNVK